VATARSSFRLIFMLVTPQGRAGTAPGSAPRGRWGWRWKNR
jgi:hypothetical protein